MILIHSVWERNSSDSTRLPCSHKEREKREKRETHRARNSIARPLAMAAATHPHTFRSLLPLDVGQNKSIFLGSVLVHDSFDKLCLVLFATPDSVHEIWLEDGTIGTIHLIICVVEGNKKKQGTHHCSLFSLSGRWGASVIFLKRS